MNIGVGALQTSKRPADMALLPMGGAVSGVAGPNGMLIGDAAACVVPRTAGSARRHDSTRAVAACCDDNGGVTPRVYRAPMRSRRDDIDPAATLRRALRRGLVGFGGVLVPPPQDLETAVELAAKQYDERLARRIARFADAEPGSLVWTRDGDGLYWLGRIDGPYRYDADEVATAVDLVHVRACRWLDRPVVEADVPAAVIATFARGGRNFQQTHDATVGAESQRRYVGNA